MCCFLCRQTNDVDESPLQGITISNMASFPAGWNQSYLIHGPREVEVLTLNGYLSLIICCTSTSNFLKLQQDNERSNVSPFTISVVQQIIVYGKDGRLLKNRSAAISM